MFARTSANDLYHVKQSRAYTYYFYIMHQSFLPLLCTTSTVCCQTPQGVFKVDSEKGLVLEEIAPNIELTTIQANTTAHFTVSKRLKVMPTDWSELSSRITSTGSGIILHSTFTAGSFIHGCNISIISLVGYWSRLDNWVTALFAKRFLLVCIPLLQGGSHRYHGLFKMFSPLSSTFNILK